MLPAKKNPNNAGQGPLNWMGQSKAPAKIVQTNNLPGCTGLPAGICQFCELACVSFNMISMQQEGINDYLHTKKGF